MPLTHLYRDQPFSFRPNLLAPFLLAVWMTAGAVTTVPGRENIESQSAPISSVLDENGSIRPGVAGSFDPSGFGMFAGANGSPHFVADPGREAVLSPAGCKDGWDNGAISNGLSGYGSVAAIAADGQGNIYVAGG